MKKLSKKQIELSRLLVKDGYVVLNQTQTLIELKKGKTKIILT